MPKMVYNYAKSITHIIKTNKFVPLGKHSVSMDTQNLKLFEDRLRNEKIDEESWFQIGHYLKTLFQSDINNVTGGHNQTKEFRSWYNLEIQKSIRTNIIDYIFEDLIYRGVLSEFVPDSSLSDDDKLPQNYDEKKKLIKQKISNNIR